MLRVAIVSALLCLATALPAIQNNDHPGRIPNEYLVVLKRTTTQTANYIENVIVKLASISGQVSVLKRFDALRSPILHIQAPDDMTMMQAYEFPEIQTIEANVIEKRIEQCGNQNSGSNLWGLSRISSRSPPNYSGARFSYESNGGSGVRVYVIDTGIRTTHNDYEGRSVFGYNAVGGSNADNNGHGTHCAGTVMGGTYGVSKGATSVAVKVLEGSTGPLAPIIDGVNWAVADVMERGTLAVFSMSVGASNSAALDSAVESAVDAGIPVVVAAGNTDSNACNVSPGRVSKVINVGATDDQEGLAGYSNWGTCVDILAPGSDILSASSTSNNGAVRNTGTSMACPHVAGAAANYLAANPSASPAQVKSYLLSGASQDYIDLRGQTSTPNLLLYENC